MSNSKLAGRGNQKLTVSTTSIGFTVPLGANRAVLHVATADVFMEDDGTAAATTDALFPVGSVVDLTDYLYELANFRFLSNGVDAVLHIWFYN